LIIYRKINSSRKTGIKPNAEFQVSGIFDFENMIFPEIQVHPIGTIIGGLREKSEIVIQYDIGNLSRDPFVPAGLLNKKNACFFNSLLHALASTLIVGSPVEIRGVRTKKLSVSEALLNTVGLARGKKGRLGNRLVDGMSFMVSAALNSQKDDMQVFFSRDSEAQEQQDPQEAFLILDREIQREQQHDVSGTCTTLSFSRIFGFCLGACIEVACSSCAQNTSVMRPENQITLQLFPSEAAQTGDIVSLLDQLFG
jgi:uncharacterized UBP type Zn finger protein